MKGTYSEELEMLEEINESIEKQKKIIAEIKESNDRIKQRIEEYRRNQALDQQPSKDCVIRESVLMELDVSTIKEFLKILLDSIIEQNGLIIVGTDDLKRLNEIADNWNVSALN